MKILLTIFFLSVCATTFCQTTISKDNQETREWIKEKIEKYGTNKISSCLEDGYFQIFSANNEFIESGTFYGYVYDDLKNCKFEYESKIYYKDIIDCYRYGECCFQLKTYGKGTFLLTFYYSEPEPNLYKRMETAFKDLIRQNKILHPTPTEKY